MGTELIVHQTLHGYSDGHRLLKSSFALSQSDLTLMNIISDISGPSSGFSFDSYITGYPLNDAYYALARTWTASEAPRIGSVWTHTLLVRTFDLETLPGLDKLLMLFMRPEGLGDLDRYGQPLAITQDGVFSNVWFWPPLDANLAARVIGSLYGHSTKPGTWISTQQPKKAEHLALAIWSQQWPSLRSSFTFCTLSFANRTVHRKPFMLQVGPRPALNAPPGGDLDIVDADASISDKPQEQWIQMLVEDVHLGDANSRLRQFLRRFGRDVGADRAKIVPLVVIFGQLSPSVQFGPADSFSPSAILSSEGMMRKLAEVVIRHFPQPSEALPLKKFLFGPVSGVEPMVLSREADLLEVLVTVRGSDALNPEQLALRDRIQALARGNREHLIKLMTQLEWRDDSLMQLEFFRGLLNALNERELALLWESQETSLHEFLTKNPDVGLAPQLWRLPQWQQEQIWTALVRAEPKGDLLRGFVTAMLDARSDFLAERLLEYRGNETVNFVLDWVDEHSEEAHALPNGWRILLARSPQEVLSWFNQTPSLKWATWFLLFKLADANDSFAGRIPLRRWIRVGESLVASKDPDLDLMAYILSLGLVDSSPEALRIIGLTFDPVHEAGLQNQLQGASWARLASCLPGNWWDWDKCERLRQGVIQSFTEHHWPAIGLLEVVKTERTLYQVLESCRTSKGGRRLLKRLKEDLKTGEIKETWRGKVLSDYFENQSFGRNPPS
jgi:hypothetical protein